MRYLRYSVLLATVLCSSLEAHGQIATVVSSVGAINQSMAGAATAMPLDASGVQYWNPAGITDLEETELDINVQPFISDTSIQSSLKTNALAPNLPAEDLSGRVRNRNWLSVLPSIGYVRKIDDSPFRWGVLITGSGGTAVNFKHRGSDPLTSRPPISSGSIKVSGQFLQISPTLAYQLFPHWSIGVQPNFNVTSFQAKPLGTAKSLEINEDGIPTYPESNKAWSTGWGVQGGLYYHNPKYGLHLGAAIKSPQWFFPYHLTATYTLENHEKRQVKLQNNFPMIASIGLGYSGIPKTKIAVDARYVDFGNTTGFDRVGFNRQNAVKGPGWKSVWVIAAGTQYQLTPKCSIRAGYAYNDSPILPINSSFSTGAPAVTKQQIAFGLSYAFKENCSLALAYHHGFFNSIQGPIQGPAGPIPNSNVRLMTKLNSVAVSLLYRF